MNLYIVRNKDGWFFRAKGFGGSGLTWVKDLDRAKFYAKLGQAKSRVTFFAKNYPDYGCPDILEFTLDLTTAKVLDMAETTQKSMKRIAKKELDRERRNNEWKLANLKAQQERIQAQIKTLS